MYSLIWILYLADIVKELHTLLYILSFICLMLALFIFGAWLNAPEAETEFDKKEEKKLFKWIFRFLKICLVTVIIAILLPTRTVIYSFAAIKTADIAYHANKNVPLIVNNTLKLIDLKIQKEIQDTLKNKKGD